MVDFTKAVDTVINNSCSSEVLKPVVANEIGNIVRRMGGSGGAADMFRRESMSRGTSIAGNLFAEQLAGWLFKKFLGRF